MRKIILVLLAVACLGLVGCAAKTEVSLSPPEAETNIESSTVYDMPFDVVWQAAIESIGKSFFMIDNIEKSSKIITITFSADNPNEFLDCGSVHVKDRDSLTTFPYAQGKSTYPAPTGGLALMPAQRTVTLIGKMNVVFSSTKNNQTSVTVNTRYVLTATDQSKIYIPVGFAGMYMPAAPQVETISFNAGQEGRNPIGNVTCKSRGVLEKRLLEGIRSVLNNS